MKQWYSSKRFWTGIITLITGISLILTGEKTLNEQLPEIIMTGLGLIQFIIAITSGEPIMGFSRKR